MKKKLLPLAIAAIMAPGFAAAADVSGFTDIIYTIADDSSKQAAPLKNTSEGKFNANAEVDFSASPADGVTVRVDLDLGLPALNTKPGGGAADSGDVEQAFFAWGVTEGVTVIGGVFNNPIGYEAEDAPDMDFTSHGAVYTALDSQTALPGDNIAGLAVAGAVGPTTVTAALLNDIGETNEENSLAVVVNYSPMAGLDMEFGLVTQKENGSSTVVPTTGSANALSVGDATNFNIVYMPAQVAGLTIGLDYLTADTVVDSASDIWVGYDFGNGFGAKFRASDISYNSADVTNIVANVGGAAATAALTAANMAGADQDSTSIYLSYQAASNLSAALEFRTDSVATPGVADTDTTLLELIATF